jgi:hypothetical protein
VRGLLQLVLDRLNECYVINAPGDVQEAVEVRDLKRQIGVVLDRGYYAGVMLPVDMCQLPHEVVR